MRLFVIILGKFEGCVNKNLNKYRKIKTAMNGYQIILLISYILIALFGYWLKFLNLSHLKKYGDVVPEEFKDYIDAQLLKKTRDYTLETAGLDSWNPFSETFLFLRSSSEDC